MKKGFFAGVLVIALVFIGCASTPSAGPSPFEGSWFVNRIEREGSLAQTIASFPYGLIFERNEFSMGTIMKNPDGEVIARLVSFSSRKFTYTDTEITVHDTDGKGGVYVFKYTLDANGLTTEDGRYGIVVWAK
jgi:hypothetical protein